MPVEEGRASRADGGYRPMVEVRRGGVVESIHCGAVVVADETGRVLMSHGDPDAVTFLRSAAKPAQVLPVLVAGAAERFRLTESEIAVMCGSHGGEPFHVDAVRSILGKIGLGEEALLCGAHGPFHRPAGAALRAAGTPPTALHNNCSGKHAGMLALSVLLGAPAATYLDPEHPVQVRMRESLGALAGLPPEAIATAVDGCSAPTFALPLRSAAAAYARLMNPAGLPLPFAAAARRTVTAMRSHPEMVAGTDRICTELMRAAGGDLVAKIGAEGFYGLGFRRDGGGCGIALKVADGDDDRARPAAVLETLRQLRLLPQDQVDRLQSRFAGDIHNHRGLVVGRVAATLVLLEPA